MSESDGEFVNTETAGAETTPIKASGLRKNGYALLKGFPCKIADMSTSKTGKHGHAKVSLVGYDIFTGKKYEDMSPSTHNMEVPVVTRVDYVLTDVQDDGFLTLMHPETFDTRSDISGNDTPELLKEIREKFEAGDAEVMVTIMGAMGKVMPAAVKTSAS